MDPSITLCGMRDNDYQHRFSFRLTSYLLCYVVRGTAYLQNRCTQSPVEIRAGSLYILYPFSWLLTGAAEIAYFLYCYKKYVKPLDRETA